MIAVTDADGDEAEGKCPHCQDTGRITIGVDEDRYVTRDCPHCDKRRDRNVREDQ